jgi:hypothetical protein
VTVARTFSEEIAFYKGAEVEKRRIMETFHIMLKQIMKVPLLPPQHPLLHLTPAACSAGGQRARTVSSP